ncbi:prolyl oligopeptidase family serine peptidase [Opitutales bacterium]|nr:prolyl oligopeptidase family serine peptidase [Opitutales bacterium]
MKHRIISAFLLLILSPGGFAQSIQADSPKTGESIARRYARSEEIAPKFQKAYQPLKLNFQWKDNGIIFKIGKGKTAQEEFIDGKTGKIKKSISLEPAKDEDDSLFLPPQSRWGRSSSSSDNISITFQNSFPRPVRVYWVDLQGELKNYGTIPPKGDMSISTFAGHQWVLDFSANDLTGIFTASNHDCIAKIDSRSRRVAMKQSPPAPKPDSTPASKLVIREHNVWFIRKDKKDIQLTRKGTEEDSFLNEFRYSPNKRYALGFQSTRVIPRKIPLLRSSPKDQIQPTIEFINYPKPGDPRPQRRPILFDLKKKTAIPVDEASFLDSWSVQFKHWSKDSRSAHVLYNKRGHQELALLSIDASNGKVTDLVRESPDTFVDYSQKTMLHWLDQSEQLIWASERSGWNHLYRIDASNGQVINPITKGKWVVRKIEHVDEKSEVVWFSALAIHPKQDPYHIHLAKVNLDGSDLTVLTQGDGTHRWEFNPERTLFVDRWSRVDHPEIAQLRSARDGSLVKELARQDISALLKEGYSMPIRFSAPGRDGKTMIHGFLIQPTEFDPNRIYPVIENIYAGPHGFHVPKKFGLQISQRRLAELGFVIAKIDGMGTNWRSKKFHDHCWQNLADAGFPDRIAWLKAAARKYSWLDLSRVGIYGGSAGGQNALSALLHHGEFYKAAVSDCGCHDNRMDKIWWNEAWMGKMGPHYEQSSNVFHAHKLQGNLMLTVGELDKNVDPASTFQVVDALVRAGKDFEFFMIPGAGHGIGEGKYLFRKRIDFFVCSLLGVEP